MTAVLAIAEETLFAIGAGVFIAVFAAALSLAYVRFAELSEDRGGPPTD